MYMNIYIILCDTEKIGKRMREVSKSRVIPLFSNSHFDNSTHEMEESPLDFRQSRSPLLLQFSTALKRYRRSMPNPRQNFVDYIRDLDLGTRVRIARF